MASIQQNNPPTVMVDVASVVVDEEVRQRSYLDKDIEALAESIARNGLIHPITIRQDNSLVAGRRRLEAHIIKGWPTIRAQYFEHLDTVSAYRVELEENLKRKRLSWQDEVRAVYCYHQMRKQTCGEWTIMATAGDISMSKSSVHRYLTIADFLGDEEVMGCTTVDGAFNLIRGRAERASAAAASRGLEILNAMPTIASAAVTKEARTAAISNLFKQDLNPSSEALVDAGIEAIEKGKMAEQSLHEAHLAEDAATAPGTYIITGDFHEWAESYEGPPFDVLHVDFPWGKGYKGSNSRKTGRAHIVPTYADDPDIFWSLLETLLTWQDKLAYPTSHMLLWFDHLYYAPIVETVQASGWTLVQPHPLVWHKPGQGVAADTKRRPRHIYEAALLFARGDRKLVRLGQDVYVGRADEKLHINQKSQAMLRAFLSMLVDEHTAVLDPTCGSGSALAVARQLGAYRVLGVESEEGNAKVARFIMNRDAWVMDGLTFDEEE